jgi:hypothetical protein
MPVRRLGLRKKPVTCVVWDGWAFNRPLLLGGLNQSEAHAPAFYHYSAVPRHVPAESP